MKKVLLICCVSLLTRFGVAQPIGSVPGRDLPELDSALFITDLVASIKESSKIVLNWKLLNVNPGDFVAVERSGNGRDFEVVSILKQNGLSLWNEWVDESPVKGRNTYRIRFAGKNGPEQYSRTVSALIAGDILSFRFYPNPVDNILIIRCEQASELQILDAGGNIRYTEKGLQGLKTINVTILEKGIYLLRVTNKVTGSISQERLLKN